MTGLATAPVAVAAPAAAGLLAARNRTRPQPVIADSRAARAALAAEELFTSAGWSRPEFRDPLAGNYRAQDGSVRVHASYRYHGAAAGRLPGARPKPGPGDGRVEGRGP